MGSRVADLMQAKTAVLSSAAEAHLQNVKQEHSDRLQHLQLEVADKECQVSPAYSCLLRAGSIPLKGIRHRHNAL